MADPRWDSNLVPVLGDVVQLLSGLLFGTSLIDNLQAQSLLTTEEYEQVCARKEQKGETAAARTAIELMQKKGPPLFENFRKALGKVDGGDKVLVKLLQASSERESSTTEEDYEQPQPEPTRYSEPPALVDDTEKSVLEATTNAALINLDADQSLEASSDAEADTTTQNPNSLLVSDDEGYEESPRLLSIKHLPSSDAKKACIEMNQKKVELTLFDKVSASIDQNGGVVTLAKTNIRMEVPKGALDSKKDLTVSVFVALSPISVAMKARTAVASVALVQLLPHGISFNKEVTIRRQLSSHEMTCGIDPRYFFYYWGGPAGSSNLSDANKYEYLGTTNLYNSISYKKKGKDISIHVIEKDPTWEADVAQAADKDKGQYCVIRSKTFCRYCQIKTLSNYSNTLLVFGKLKKIEPITVIVEARLTCQCEPIVKGIIWELQKKGYSLADNDWKFTCEDRNVKGHYVKIVLKDSQECLRWSLEFQGFDIIAIHKADGRGQTNQTAMVVCKDGEVGLEAQHFWSFDSDRPIRKKGFFWSLRSAKDDSGHDALQVTVPQGDSPNDDAPKPKDLKTRIAQTVGSLLKYFTGAEAGNEPRLTVDGAYELIEQARLKSLTKVKQSFEAEKSLDYRDVIEVYLGSCCQALTDLNDRLTVAGNPQAMFFQEKIDTLIKDDVKKFKMNLEEFENSIVPYKIKNTLHWRDYDLNAELKKRSEKERLGIFLKFMKNVNPKSGSAVDEMESYLSDMSSFDQDDVSVSKNICVLCEGLSQFIPSMELLKILGLEENEIDAIPTKGEKLHHCLRKFVVDLRLAEAMLVQAGNKAGFTDANRRPKSSELLELSKSVNVQKIWPDIAHCLGMDKHRIHSIQSTESVLNPQEQTYEALSECFENPHRKSTLFDFCNVVKCEFGEMHLQNILRDTKSQLWWLALHKFASVT